MTYTTQCPACQTRFKVTDAQLTVADGLVRCGRCAHVFDAREHLQSSEPPRLDTPADIPAPPSAVPPAPPAAAPASALEIEDDFELEVPDFDPTDVSSSEPEPGFDGAQVDDTPPDEGQPSAQDVEAFQRALNEALAPRPFETTRTGYVSALAEEPGQDTTAALEEPLGDPFAEAPPQDDDVPAIFDTRRTAGRPEPQADAAAEKEAVSHADFDPAMPADSLAEGATRPRSPFLTVIMVLLSLLGVLTLALQLVYFNRVRITAEAPEMRPVLERLCHIAGCSVPLPTDQEYIRTEWSELSFVPEHQNLILLSATLKNHAPYAQAFPLLEVTLKDSDDQVLIRKTFTQREYLKSDDLKLARFNPNSEIKIGMRFDLGQVHAQGYSLYWFYP
ncbi:DUF3426 domain-containing protein [Paludibacterium yongneupense]|uniref:DUF3426 domain-containing protein n=1 Tax=Paludibacterium yongneupense TaxID=400061 RepID=UPI00048EA42D|nr:DUF3426 domain-containing protein [Paludibacterium yongneupense]